ncbi:hypothetical protein EJB05_33014, partial [Eragrostis curvula]
MAASSRAAIVIVSLILLASSRSLVHARMMPSDLQLVRAGETGVTSSSTSQDLHQVFMAPPAVSRKPEIAAVERRQIIQVDGSEKLEHHVQQRLERHASNDY